MVFKAEGAAAAIDTDAIVVTISVKLAALSRLLFAEVIDADLAIGAIAVAVAASEFCTESVHADIRACAISVGGALGLRGFAEALVAGLSGRAILGGRAASLARGAEVLLADFGGCAVTVVGAALAGRDTGVGLADEGAVTIAVSVAVVLVQVGTLAVGGHTLASSAGFDAGVLRRAVARGGARAAAEAVLFARESKTHRARFSAVAVLIAGITKLFVSAPGVVVVTAVTTIGADLMARTVGVASAFDGAHVVDAVVGAVRITLFPAAPVVTVDVAGFVALGLVGDAACIVIVPTPPRQKGEDNT